jgi:hypothetical protein
MMFDEKNPELEEKSQEREAALADDGIELDDNQLEGVAGGSKASFESFDFLVPYYHETRHHKNVHGD